MHAWLKYGWGIAVTTGLLVTGIPFFTGGRLCDVLHYALRWVFVGALGWSVLLFPFWLIRKWAVLKVELWGCSMLVGLGLGLVLFLGIGLFQKNLVDFLSPEPKLYEDGSFVVRKYFRDTFETEVFPVLSLYQKEGCLEYCICEDMLSEVSLFDMLEAPSYMDTVSWLRMVSVQPLGDDAVQLDFEVDGIAHRDSIPLRRY